MAIAAGGAALLALLLFFGFQTGRDVERSAWLSRQAQQVQADQAQFNDRLQHANKAAAAAQNDARTARDFATQLQQEIAHVRVPLVVPARSGACNVQPGVLAAAPPGVVASRNAPAVVDAAATPQPAPAPPDGAQGLDDDRSAVLTLAAIRLWNSALAGAQLPAGACRADDPTSSACAAASAADIDDAFANHIENAARCRQDRAQLTRLIDYLGTTQGTTQDSTQGTTQKATPP